MIFSKIEKIFATAMEEGKEKLSKVDNAKKDIVDTADKVFKYGLLVWSNPV